MLIAACVFLTPLCCTQNAQPVDVAAETAAAVQRISFRQLLVGHDGATNAAAFTPDGGTFTGGTLVTLSAGQVGGDIHYTTDGSDPTVSSARYTNPISINQSLTLKARTFKSGFDPSPVASAPPHRRFLPS